MESADSYSRLLRILILVGGVFELMMGIVILVAGDWVVSSTGGSPVPVFALYWRTLGLLAIALGGLQIHASRNPERYIAIPIAASLVRVFLPILTGLQLMESPSMSIALILSTAFDFALALVTLVLLYMLGLLRNK
ncbi:MAG: hypothetical protein ACFFD6_09910 [Candidatus Thorarchaeota archaeon]